MSEVISIPLNKLVRSERNVRKTGGNRSRIWLLRSLLMGSSTT
jgi:hypothetical protein